MLPSMNIPAGVIRIGILLVSRHGLALLVYHIMHGGLDVMRFP